MADWKKQIDELLEQRRNSAAAREAERLRQVLLREEDKKRKQKEKAEADYRKRLAKHQRKLRCVVCGVASDGPALDTAYWKSKGEYGSIDFHPYQVTNWKKSVNLHRCANGHWVCTEHFHLDKRKQCWGY